MQSFVRISVSTSASHALEPGSIPGRSILFFSAEETDLGIPTTSGRLSSTDRHLRHGTQATVLSSYFLMIVNWIYL